HPQAEALGGVIGRRLQPPVVEQERFALGALDEQLPVVGAAQRIGQDFLGAGGIDSGGVEDRGGGDRRVHRPKIGAAAGRSQRDRRRRGLAPPGRRRR